MSIILKNAPGESFEELVNNNYLIDSFRPIHTHHDNDPSHDAHPHYIPHSIYSIGMDDALEGKGLDDADLLGWRYIIADEHDDYHAIKTITEDGKHRVHSVNSGSHVNSFVRKFEELKEFQPTKENDYELSVIRISELYVMAIWLKAENIADSYLVPLDPVPADLSGLETYTYNEFMGVIQGMALNAKIKGFGLQIAELTGSNEPASEDDLTKIEGIGEKSAKLLKSAGYTTFQSLANASVEDIEKVLESGGARYNLLDPSTWPEQAKLAAEGKWEELKVLQDELKGGKRN